MIIINIKGFAPSLLENYYGIGRNAVSYIKTQDQTLIINNSKQKINVLSANEILMHKLGQGLLLKRNTY